MDNLQPGSVRMFAGTILAALTSSRHDTLIFLGLTSVIFASFGFLIIAFLVSRGMEKSDDPHAKVD